MTLREHLSKVSEALDEILLECRRILHRTLGKPLTASWIGWNVKENAWCEAAPVILEIGGIHCEICWMKAADCALSQDLINTQEPFYCYGSQEFSGVWKENALPQLRHVLGQVLTGMELIEAEVTISSEKFVRKYWVPNGLLFKFGEYMLYVYNGFDLNGIAGQPPGDAEFRSVAVAL